LTETSTLISNIAPAITTFHDIIAALPPEMPDNLRGASAQGTAAFAVERPTSVQTTAGYVTLPANTLSRRRKNRIDHQGGRDPKAVV